MDFHICLRLKFNNVHGITEQRSISCPHSTSHQMDVISFSMDEIRLNGYVLRANTHVHDIYSNIYNRNTNQHTRERSNCCKLFISYTCNMICSTDSIRSVFSVHQQPVMGWLYSCFTPFTFHLPSFSCRFPFTERHNNCPYIHPNL